MFGDLAAVAGGVNRWHHSRRPTPIQAQTVIRMNRDTLYSVAIVDLGSEVMLTVPDAGERYMSVMVVDQDHYVNEIIHDAGDHVISPTLHRSRFVAVAARILVDPNDVEDVAAVNALQDRFVLDVGGSGVFECPDYDKSTLDSTRKALLQLAGGLSGFERTFGMRSEVDPVRHLIGTAAGWGGLPEREAHYLNVSPGLPVDDYELRVVEVPVDGFWSISMYDRSGFFAANPYDAYTVNDVTAVAEPDGSVIVRFGGGEPTGENFLPVVDGWNYVVRLYLPRPAVLDGTWDFPSPVAVHP